MSKSNEIALKLGLGVGIDRNDGSPCPECKHPVRRHRDMLFKDVTTCKYCGCDHYPPMVELTTPKGANALMTALQGHYFYMCPAAGGWGVIIDDDPRTESYAATWREALVEAAWKLLCE